MAWEAPDTWIWPDDFAAYAEGRLDASQVHSALCQHGPCDCPVFGTAGHFARIDKRHGRTGG